MRSIVRVVWYRVKELKNSNLKLYKYSILFKLVFKIYICISNTDLLDLQIEQILQYHVQLFGQQKFGLVFIRKHAH